MKYDEEAVTTAEYIRKVANGKKIESEVEVSLMRDGKEITYGTYDAYCEGHLFDLKTGRMERNYVPQMAVYAAAICQRDGIDKIEIHLIYSALNKVDKFTLTREEAEGIAFKITDSVNDPTRSPNTSEYCNWCGRQEICSALNGTAMTVAKKQEMILEYEVSAITNPETMGMFKDVAAACSVFIDMVKKKSEEFDEIDGWKKSTRKGSRKVANINGAFSKTGLPPDVFIEACSISYPKLKKLFAENKGISEQEAEEMLFDLLSSEIKEGHPVKYWRKDK
jgi:CRISPR/Cas system-associated exonuclease Cas4 (RecB family)